MKRKVALEVLAQSLKARTYSEQANYLLAGIFHVLLAIADYLECFDEDEEAEEGEVTD